MTNIFLSYSWVEYGIADHVDEGLRHPNIKVFRDIRDVPFRSSIRSFMDLIRSTPYVVMLLSDAYLRSENCMYEVTELLSTNELEKRIIPLVTDTAGGLFDLKGRADYYEYWQTKVSECSRLHVRYPNDDTLQTLTRVKKIEASIGGFLAKILELKVMPEVDARRQGYKPIYDLVGMKRVQALSGIGGGVTGGIIGTHPALSFGVDDDMYTLMVSFYATQSLSLRVQALIEEFIVLYDAQDKMIWPDRNITYGTYLAQMKESYEWNLKSDLIREIMGSNQPVGVIRSMLDSINTQMQALQLIETEFLMHIRQAKVDY